MGARGGAAVIPNGTSESNVVDAGLIETLAVQAPASIDGATTYKVQGTVDGTNFQDLTDGTMDAASEIVSFIGFPYTAFRIKASGNVGAARSFVYSAGTL